MKDLAIDIILTTMDNEQVQIKSTMSAAILFDFFKEGSTCINAMCEAISIAYLAVELMDEEFDSCYNIHVFNADSTELLFETSTEM